MVDIHTHVIPGFDDGSRDLDESLKIVEAEWVSGTRTMFATPHVQTDLDIDRSEQIVERVAALNAELSSRSLGMKLVQGAELFPSMAILHGLDKGRPISLAGSGKYLLVDLPHAPLPLDFDSVLFELQSRGITPILAHPERCPAFQPNPEEVLPYAERGIAFQLNAGSFAGRHGAGALACAKQLFRMRVAHFLASDAHRVHKHSLGEMANTLSLEDGAYVKILTVSSGEAVLHGQPLPDLPKPTVVEKKQSLFSRLFNR